MKRCALWLSVFTLLGVVMACGSQDAGKGSATAVISGTVSAGPVSPLTRAGQPNTRAVSGARVEVRHGTDVVDVVLTDHSGHYTVTLPPGTYVVLVDSGRYPFATPEPKTVIASAGQTHSADFVLDTGIR